ncbi:MAG: thiamine/thiamine pyrophosphate ABC transporter permease, partial [Gammaproteobacteria bacterium]|nr:thiamine/thiamine pyrophosphate ABC transporter permease [Gammaproteobacteria bacterium]
GALALAGLGALLQHADASAWQALLSDRYLHQVIRFSLWQATLSTLLSVLLAIPVARALARRATFAGRAWMLRSMELTLVLPAIVAVFGLIAVHGRQGWFSQIGQAMGLAPFSYSYGLSGILLAHVFFNLPLAARLMLQALEQIPDTQWRLAAQLGLNSGALWRVLEWPTLRRTLAPLIGLIFTLCFTSFAIVMTLGKGPSTTTLEVAIYQALRFEFDFGLAAVLALVQLGICGGLWLQMLRRQPPEPALYGAGSGLAVAHPRRDQHGLSRLLDGGWLVALVLLVVPPVVAVVYLGMPALPEILADSRVQLAWLRSLAVAALAGALAVGMALLLLGAHHDAQRRGRAWRAQGLMLSGQLVLIVPALVLGTGLFVLLRPTLGSTLQGLGLVVFINSLMALPFALQVLRGPLNALDAPSQRLADMLGMRGWYRWRWLVWPRLRHPIWLAWAYAQCLSLGDFSVIALFGSPAEPTLPMLLYQQLGSYRLSGAAGTALLMLLTLLAIFGICRWRAGPRAPVPPSSPTAAPSALEPAHAGA